MKKHFLTFLMLFITAGCSSVSPYVAPTPEEMEAVRALKKSAAIVRVTENGTKILGFGTVFQNKLTDALSETFKIIDPQVWENAMQSATADITNMSQLVQVGKSVGVDYIIITNANFSLRGPSVQYTLPEMSSKGFYAKIWSEKTSRTDVDFKLVSTQTGIVSFSDKFWGEYNHRSDEVEMHDLIQYNKAIDAAKMVRQIKNATDVYTDMKQDARDIIVYSMDAVLGEISKSLRLYVVQTGEILKIVSADEVLINLGSAYGLRVDQDLTVWDEGPPIQDPKTGMKILSKTFVGGLTVSGVTSGLSCTAKGRKIDVSKMRVGNKVYIGR